jgi:3-isopropylmalate dehydrogenase
VARIAVIAGDGIGVEVIAEAVQILEQVSRKHQIPLELEHLDYGANRYLADGTTLPKAEIERFRREKDAILLGALGDTRIPDMRHGREILLAMRVELDLYINFRPVRCLDDRLCPLKGKSAAQVNFVVFRENTEGLYADRGGITDKGTANEVAVNEDVNTRRGVERIIRAAFAWAQAHGKTRVTMTDKSNAVRYAHDLWRRTFAEVGAEYPKIESEHLYVDAMMVHLLQRPEDFQVVVTNNMFGDIITDLGAALQGGLGMAASANLNPKGVALFEPVHGSAPTIAGKGIANPIAAILTVALMLDHLGFAAAAADVEAAVLGAIHRGELPRDVGGRLSTREVGAAISSGLRTRR